MKVTRRKFLGATGSLAAAVASGPSAAQIFGGPDTDGITGQPVTNFSPFIGQSISNDDWSRDWSVAKFFSVGASQFVFLLKTTNGLMRIHRLQADGRLDALVSQSDWRSGWTQASFMTTSQGTFLFVLRTNGLSEAGFRLHVYRMDADGSLGPRVDQKVWQDGWTRAATYQHNNKNFLIVYRSGNALTGNVRARIYQVGNDGLIDSSVFNERTWAGNWTSIVPYYVDGATHILLVRSGTAISGVRARVFTLDANSIPQQTKEYGWSAGWTGVTFIEAASRPYLLLYKSSNGHVHVHALQQDGGVGTRVAWYTEYGHSNESEGTGSLAYRDGPRPWTSNWTILESFKAGNGQTRLFLLKSSTGKMILDPIYPMRDVGPAVTHASHDSATIWLGLVGGRRDRRPAYEIRYRSGPGPWQNAPVSLTYPGGPQGEASPAQDYFVSAQANLTPLQPHQAYEYQVVAGGKPIGGGSFKSAPNPGSATNFRVAVASCMDVNKSRIQPAWNAVRGRQPDLLLLLGDSAYPNSTDRCMQWAEHLQQRAIPSFARVVSQVPTYAQWDDHDFGPNNCAGLEMATTYRTESRDTFRELFPHPLRTHEANYFKLTWGLVDFFLLDCRYYANRHNSGFGNQLIGPQQRQWLEQQLTASNAKFKIISTGITLRTDATENWRDDYGAELVKLIEVISHHSGVVILSGDVHWCDVRKHPTPFFNALLPTPKYPLYEVISSGMDSESSANTKGFALLDFELTPKAEKVQVSLIRSDNTLQQPPTVITRLEIS
jgi:alkaline phosphatase D